MAIYLFFIITQILNFHYGINQFCSEFHHYLCSSISFMNKIDLNLFSSCCPQKWFPRWGIMSYKNIRLTLNMDSGGILFWNSCSINWLLVPQVNQIELGYMIFCVKQKITLYMFFIYSSYYSKQANIKICGHCLGLNTHRQDFIFQNIIFIYTDLHICHHHQ